MPLLATINEHNLTGKHHTPNLTNVLFVCLLVCLFPAKQDTQQKSHPPYLFSQSCFQLHECPRVYQISTLTSLLQTAAVWYCLGGLQLVSTVLTAVLSTVKYLNDWMQKLIFCICSISSKSSSRVVEYFLLFFSTFPHVWQYSKANTYF